MHTTESRSRRYLILLIVLMGLVGLMDQYLSAIESTAVPYLLRDFNLSASDFAWLKTRFMIVTFFVFALNSLNDLIGRRYSILILVLIMGISSLAIVLYTPTAMWFMIFYSAAIFATISNMWTIPISEEAPAEIRAKAVAVVYCITLLPLSALLPPLLIDRLGLDWRWLYGVMFLAMIPIGILWLFMRETSRFEAIAVKTPFNARARHLFGFGTINRTDIRYIAFTASILVFLLVSVTLAFWAGYFFLTIRGYSLSTWSAILLVQLTLAILGGLTGGWILDRIGRYRGLIIGFVGIGIALFALEFASGFGEFVAFALTGFFAGIASTWAFVYSAEIFPTERRGACVGWVTATARISYIISPALAAFLLDRFPTMQWFWLSAGIVALIPVLIILWFRPQETRALELEEIELRRSSPAM